VSDNGNGNTSTEEGNINRLLEKIDDQFNGKHTDNIWRRGFKVIKAKESQSHRFKHRT